MSDHPLELMDEFLRAREQGTPLGRDQFLAAHPNHTPEFVAAIDDYLLAEREIARALPPLAAPTFDAGTPFGDFVLVRRIGAGAMGVVYEAEQTALGRRVALKTMNPNRPGFTRERFLREASLSARLRHDGIAAVHAVGERGDVCWFAMDLVRGAPLDAVITVLRRKRFSLRTGGDLLDVVRAEIARLHGGAPRSTAASDSTVVAESYEDAACRLVAGIADALAHAHEQGVIHRDVKPSNILIRENGSPVLTDFGLAIAGGVERYTRDGEFAGTPLYASPEQADGRVTSIDARTDVFSLGVTLFELLAFRRPFSGDSLRELLEQIVEADAPPLRRFNPRVNADLQTIVSKALEKSRDRRYASATEFADDLRRYLARDPIHARPPSLFERGRRLLRRRALPAVLLVVFAILGFTGWSARDAVQHVRRQNVFIRLLEAAHDGQQPDATDLALFASMVPDDDARARLLRNPSDPGFLKYLHETYLGGTRAGGEESLRLLEPRSRVVAGAPRLRIGLGDELRARIGATTWLAVTLERSSERFDLVESKTVRVARPTAPEITIESADLGVDALVPGANYRWIVVFDPAHLRGVFEQMRLSRSFQAASAETLARIRNAFGSGDRTSDELMRAALELSFDMPEAALERLHALPKSLDPDFPPIVRALEAEALARLERSEEFAALQAADR